MLQVYTGNGKGKTTAAIGLAIRALGAGKRIYMMQFMKSLAYSEQKILQAFAPQLCLRTAGKPFFIAQEGSNVEELAKQSWAKNTVIFPPGHPPREYVALMEKGLQKAWEDIQDGMYDVVILDEVNVALFFQVLERESVEDFLQKISPNTEIVCTGRKAPDWLIERADLVTEMHEVKHYYTRGILAREGIEN